MKPITSRMLDWFRRHKLDVIILTVVLAITGTVSALNMSGYPQRFEDEGTYISQAWAIKETGSLTHYTYWYDHPPAGWAQMAAHLFLTDALDRHESAVSAGREFMLLLHIATIGLLFALARRLGIGTIAAAIGTLAFGLSPLVVEFSRYVLLDNVALPWMLAAMFLALSPRRHIATAIGAAVCFAIAVLSKETFLVLLPVLLYGLWQVGDKRNRRYTFVVFGVTLGMIGAFYALYAFLKNEFFPGDGHVSLLGSLAWQVLGREGSGSIFDAASGTRGLVEYWLRIDYWLLLAGIVTLPFAFLWRNLRVVALGLAIGLVLLLRGGYLPYPYVVAVLPFAALVFAGVLHYAVIVPLTTKSTSTIRWMIATGAACILLIGSLGFVAPTWHDKLNSMTTQDYDVSSRQAIEWAERYIPRNSRMVVESAFWTDLKERGFADPVWLYKTETDPAVVEEIGGWQGIDYVILNGPTVGAGDFAEGFPTVHQAIDNATIMAVFGVDNQKVTIYKVNQ